VAIGKRGGEEESEYRRTAEGRGSAAGEGAQGRERGVQWRPVSSFSEANKRAQITVDSHLEINSVAIALGSRRGGKGAVQRNGNKVHGLRGTESYGYSIALQSLRGLLDVRSESARVPVLPDSS